ncbi:MAG: tRNA pseudouridine(38-40) synthase TruA [Hyphomicrobiaceae bacterium]
MPRYSLTIEYDGTPFVGWQVQTEGRSVQGRLAEAIHKFTAATVVVHGAGRTDAGVHATGQVAHVDLAKTWEWHRIRDALNFHLRPDPIVVTHVIQVADDFHARFSAIGRHYLYRILNRQAPPGLERNRVWWVTRPLDLEAMAEAARHLVGHHDFTTFRSTSCQAKSPVKTLDRLQVTRSGEEIRIEVSARSFLHHQVRSMVGSLKLVGEGRWQPSDLVAALAARDRTRCGAMAPSAGLYLTKVDYPDRSEFRSPAPSGADLRPAARP